MDDALLHPLARVDPWFLVLDGLLHGLIERNPSETIVKFIHHNLQIIAQQTFVPTVLESRCSEGAEKIPHERCA
jgi:hypothetical protein